MTDEDLLIETLQIRIEHREQEALRWQHEAEEFHHQLVKARSRIEELERELLLVPCVTCSGMSREQWERGV